MKKLPTAISLSVLSLACPLLWAQQAGAPPVSNARLETLSPVAGLAATIQQVGSRGRDPFWIGYSVPMVAGQGRFCCFDKDFESATCRLEGKNQGWGCNGRDQRRADQKMNVLLRFAEGKINEIRSFSEDCPLDAGGRRFVWLGSVKPEESVAYLADLARTARSGDEDPASKAIASLAMHRNANAETALEKLASLPSSRQTREDALFWLAQMDAPKAPETILAAIEKDPDPGVRKHAVFALSQLDDGKSVTYLIRLGKESSQREIRKEAYFWLAQSDDPAALKYLDNVLNED